jgi:hypothetical protein
MSEKVVLIAVNMGSCIFSSEIFYAGGDYLNLAFWIS